MNKQQKVKKMSKKGKLDSDTLDMIKALTGLVVFIAILALLIVKVKSDIKEEQGRNISTGWYVDTVSNSKINVLSGGDCFTYMDRVSVGKMDARIYVEGMDYSRIGYCLMVDDKGELKLYEGSYVKKYYEPLSE